jgi:dolichyldiphosphatase
MVDKLGDVFVSKIGKTAQYFVAGTAFLTISIFSSYRPLYFVACGVANSILSKVLKFILKEPRPPSAPKAGYGMPSSHSQSILYFATVLLLTVLHSVHEISATLSVSQPFAERISFLCVVLLLSYSYFAW